MQPSERTELLHDSNHISDLEEPILIKKTISDEDSDNIQQDIVTKDGIAFPASSPDSRSVTTFQMVVLLFFCVAGGPYGLEDAVAAAGSGYTLLAIIIIPIIYSLPVAMMTAELSTAMPNNGGYIIWVARACNSLWGYQEGYWSYVSNIFDNALYPALFAAYIETMFNHHSRILNISVRLIVVILVTIVDIMGLTVVGSVSIVLAVITLAPFIIMIFYTIPDYSPNEWVSTPIPFHDVNYGLLLSVVVWNNAGWDSLGTVAGNVKRPKKTYPRAMAIALTMVFLTNALPIMVAVSIDKDINDYDAANGFWASLGEKIAGPWLKYMVVASSLIANLGMFVIVLTTSSWALFAIALPGMMDIPALTKIHPKTFTPYNAILVNAVGVALCSFLSFDSILQVDTSLNCFSMVLEVVALVLLRINEPEMRRPFKIPLNTIPLAIFVSPVVVICLGIAFTIGYLEQLMVGGFLVLGFILFYVSKLWSSHKTDVNIEEVFEALDNLEENMSKYDSKNHSRMNSVSSSEMAVRSVITVPESPPVFSNLEVIDRGPIHFIEDLELDPEAHTPLIHALEAGASITQLLEDEEFFLNDE